MRAQSLWGTEVCREGKKKCVFFSKRFIIMLCLRSGSWRWGIQSGGIIPFGVQRGQRKCEISNSFQCIMCHWALIAAPLLTCHRCWRALRSWTTACCWGCTSWTRAREMGVSQARQGVTGGDLWVRGCFTPLPWSPSRETARPPKPSPQTTRESARLGENTYYARVFGHTHSCPCLSVCLSLNLHIFSPRTQLHNRAHTSHRTLEQCTHIRALI